MVNVLFLRKWQIHGDLEWQLCQPYAANRIKCQRAFQRQTMQIRRAARIDRLRSYYKKLRLRLLVWWALNDIRWPPFHWFRGQSIKTVSQNIYIDVRLVIFSNYYCDRNRRRAACTAFYIRAHKAARQSISRISHRFSFCTPLLSTFVCCCPFWIANCFYNRNIFARYEFGETQSAAHNGRYHHERTDKTWTDWTTGE